ncbi:DUF1963 domain-containing protein [Streptomyces sp. NPDC005722]
MSPHPVEGPAPHDLLPELASYRRPTTLLRPKQGSPGVRESSLGGPVLWPADEPWPHCDRPGHLADFSGLPVGRIPMVPVLQLFARDVAQLRFPDGKDVLQILWCPLLHPDDEVKVSRPSLHWRAETDVPATKVLDDVPAPGEGEYYDEFIPRPCTVSPSVDTDYANMDLPRDLLKDLPEPALDAVEELLGRCHETKVGGYPAWNQEPDWPDCARGHRMEHLLSITADDEHDMVMGDAGGVYFFLCRRCPELPYAHRYDC